MTGQDNVLRQKLCYKSKRPVTVCNLKRAVDFYTCEIPHCKINTKLNGITVAIFVPAQPLPVTVANISFLAILA